MSLQTALKTVDYKCIQYIQITHYATVYRLIFCDCIGKSFFFKICSI